jgi:hypothetical protein
MNFLVMILNRPFLNGLLSRLWRGPWFDCLL